MILITVDGMPGTGVSEVARFLADSFELEHLGLDDINNISEAGAVVEGFAELFPEAIHLYLTADPDAAHDDACVIDVASIFPGQVCLAAREACDREIIMRVSEARVLGSVPTAYPSS